ncbi:serine/threonine-protein kinase [Streptomyces sp. S6]
MVLREGDPEALGEYRIVDRLGAGGMGVVYRARSRSGREVAVKVVHDQYAADVVFRARFRQEIAAARKVSGAFTAPVVDADPDAERPWMATQYVPGRSLAARVRDDGPLTGVELRRLALGLVEALRDIHRAGVVHRDLKPANVMLADDGPRVIDFGISRAAENQQLTETGHMMGTPPFMSPEQLTDARTVGPASDVFSLAALLTYAATGRGPFDAESPYIAAYQVLTDEPVLDGVPKALHDSLALCLAKDPAARPTLDTLAPAFVTALPEGDTDDALTVAHRPPDPVRTMLRDAAPETAWTNPAPAPVSLAPVSAEPAPQAPTPRRRSRRLPLLAGVVGVLAVALLAYFFVPLMNGKAHTATPSASPSPDRWAKLPADWKPWQTTVFATAERGVKKAPEDAANNGGNAQPICVEGADSVFCTGNEVFPVRVDAATGRTLWRAAALPEGAAVNRYGAAPLGVRDRTFLVVESIMNAAGNDSVSRVAAYDVDTGKRLWSRPSQAGLADPTVVGEVVIVPDGGAVTARDPRTGNEMWTLTQPVGYGCEYRADGTALHADCTNYHTASGADRVLFTVDPVDGSTGRLRSAPSAKAAFAGTLDDGRLVYAELNDDRTFTRIDLVDPAAGTARVITLAEPQQGSPAVVHGVLCFVTSSGRVTGVSPLTGARRWQTATTLERPTPPVADGLRSLFITTASGRAAALDAASGKLLWETRPRAAQADFYSGSRRVPLLARGALIVPTPDGTLFSLDPAHPN